MKTYNALCQFLGVPSAHPDILLHRLSGDSRDIKAGDVFCAYRGEHHDGHNYIQAAIDQGAALILAEKEVQNFSVPVLTILDLRKQLSKIAAWFYDYPSKKLKLIGVTGTNGKTSTTHYLAQLLFFLGHKVGVIGTIGNGLWGELAEGTHTTPDAITLQRQLANFVAQGVEYVCMEVSSHAIALGRINDVVFTCAVFTNLSQDHLDFHGTMDAYANTKAQFFAWPHLKTAILNKDDAMHQRFTQQIALTTKVFYYSLHSEDEAISYAQVLNLTAQGLSFTLRSPFGVAEVSAPLLGEFNASNLLAALTTLASLNFSIKELAKLCSLLHPVKGRMEVIRHKHLPLVVIDYAHTPDALAKALAALKIYQRPLWVVFGCGGNRDAGKRPQMAKVTEQFADQVIVTEDNSRFEEPLIIFEDIFKGFKTPERVKLIHTRNDAIIYALTHAPRDAIILLAGKGHETYLDKQGQKIHFDERDIIKSL